MKKILIVEDDHKLQDLFKSELEKEQYIVIQAFNGESALSLVTQEKPDLVLLDIMLPNKMNGFEVLKQIKLDPDLKKIPVVMLTNLPGESHTAKELGAADYLLKADMDIESIKRKVKQYTSFFGF